MIGVLLLLFGLAVLAGEIMLIVTGVGVATGVIGMCATVPCLAMVGSAAWEDWRP